jgi:hypothetical protein
MGKKELREVYGQLILCLSVLTRAHKAILMALYSTDPVNPNFCPNPKFKKLILQKTYLVFADTKYNEK